MILALVVIFVVLFIALPLLGLAASALISVAIVGLVVGALGRLLVPGRQRIGLLATVLLGLVGSIVGSFLGHRVLGIGAFSLLLEIGVAAVAVAVYASLPSQHRPLNDGKGRSAGGELANGARRSS